MPGPDGRPGVYGGTVNPPGPADDARAAAVIARSDARDARPLDDVAAEVARRSGPIHGPERGRRRPAPGPGRSPVSAPRPVRRVRVGWCVPAQTRRTGSVPGSPRPDSGQQ